MTATAQRLRSIATLISWVGVSLSLLIVLVIFGALGSSDSSRANHIMVKLGTLQVLKLGMKISGTAFLMAFLGRSGKRVFPACFSFAVLFMLLCILGAGE
jgi:hypothetical protein